MKIGKEHFLNATISASELHDLVEYHVRNEFLIRGISLVGYKLEDISIDQKDGAYVLLIKSEELGC